MFEAEQIAWKAYNDACNTRYAHIHTDYCEKCWNGKNSRCRIWRKLTAEVNRTRDAWLNSNEAGQ